MNVTTSLRVLALAAPLAMSGLALAAAVTPAAPPAGQVTSLTETLRAQLLLQCAASATEADMLQTILQRTAGQDIQVTYAALIALGADTGLCATASAAVLASQQLAVTAICADPALAAQYAALRCSATGSIGQNGAPGAAAFLTGGLGSPTGSGY